MCSHLQFILHLTLWSLVSGQKCTLPTGEEGYCRESNDCVGFGEKANCDENVCCKSNGKAAIKCKEYAKYFQTEDYSVTLSAKITRNTVSECSQTVVPLIVGGKKARPMEFPHMALIGFGTNIESVIWSCGGSLISENFVLSAAHCLNSGKNPASFVRLGTLYKHNPEKGTFQDRRIIERIKHPMYKYPASYYDIALFKLESPVTFNKFCRPACLYLFPDEFNLNATATGWGSVRFRDMEGSEELLKVDLHIYDYDYCNASFARDLGSRVIGRGVTTTQLCAGDKNGGRDTCQGDSGGPLQVLLKDPPCMYGIVGVTNFGKFCGGKNSPAIYSRVFYYIPWIESIVWP